MNGEVHWLRIRQRLLLVLGVLMLSACGGQADDEQISPLMVAARDGDLATVYSLLSEEEDVNALSAYQWTALMFAAAEGHEDVVAALLAAGARADQVSDSVPPAAFATRGGYYPTTALAEAIKYGHDTTAEHLLTQLASIHPIELVAAAQREKSLWLERLVERGGDPSQPSELTYEGSPLHAAAAAGRTHHVTWLIQEIGVDVNQRAKGTDALERAVRDDHVETVARLLELGANPNARYDDSTMPTVLLVAIKKPVGDARLERNLQVVEALLRHGADPRLEPDYSVFGLGVIGEDRNALDVARASVVEYQGYFDSETDPTWRETKATRLRHRQAILALLENS